MTAEQELKPGAVFASGLLVLAGAFEWGPLGFLPAGVRLPLIAAALYGWWRPPGRRGALALEAGCLTLVLVNWALLRVVGLHPSRADDGIYFYLAQRFAEGAVPYRDFFFAHPPLHLAVPALVFELAGFSVVLAKALPAVIQTTAGLMLYLAVRPRSRALALATLTVHLGSYQVLMGATDLTGANLVAALLMAALLAGTRGRFFACGGLAGLALGAGLYAAAGVVAVATLGGRAKRAWARIAVGCAAGVAAWLVPFALLGGRAFFDDIFGYQLAKGPAADRASLLADGPLAIWRNLGAYLSGGDALETFYFHAPQWIAAAIALGLVARRRHEPGGALAGIGLLAVALFTLQWAGLGQLHEYYSVPELAFLALPAAWGPWRLFERLRGATAWPAPIAPGTLLAMLFLAPVAAWVARGALWPEERRHAGERVEYRWSDPWVPAPIAALSRALYFAPERARDSLQPGYRHYVWNKGLTLSTAEELAAYVRARSEPTETIAGASTLAPIVALLSGRRLAADEADTNAQRFATGLFTERDFFHRVCADDVRLLIAAPQAYFSEQRLDQDPTVRRYFERDRDFVEPAVRHGRSERYVIYRRKDGPRCEYVEP